MCLAGMSKSAYYRRKRRWREVQSEVLRGTRRARGSRCFRCPKRKAIRKQAREIALAFPAYGYRKIWTELLRRGIPASPSTVYRALKEEGFLLPMKRRSEKTRTND